MIAILDIAALLSPPLAFKGLRVASFLLTGSQDEPDETKSRILYIQPTGLFRPIERHSEARAVPKSNDSFCPFTAFANGSKAGMNMSLEAAGDVNLFSER
jgi:hypothetical protein